MLVHCDICLNLELENHFRTLKLISCLKRFIHKKKYILNYINFTSNIRYVDD